MRHKFYVFAGKNVKKLHIGPEKLMLNIRLTMFDIMLLAAQSFSLTVTPH